MHVEHTEAAGLGILDLDAFRAAVRAWLATDPELPQPDEHADFAGRVRTLRELQAILFDEGWARYGWPEEVGGLGGDARHRAVLYDELSLAGHATRSVFEHVEILAPALLRHWNVDSLGLHLPRFLRGDDVWSQGFSEPEAGSDLTAARTRAVRDGDCYRITGHKIWTSWAAYADRCVVLARTGPAELRHRGLSAFFVDLDSPGVDARAIRQANGMDELAEVFFDDVVVPADRLIGLEGGGWPVGLDILSCERSAFAWLRQTRLYTHADRIAAASAEAGGAGADQVGDMLLDLFAVRAAAADAVDRLAADDFVGPGAAPVKVMLSRAEQQVYDTALRVLGPDVALGSAPNAGHWQEDYLFSRIVTVYGGTRQMQLTTIARMLLGLKEEA